MSTPGFFDKLEPRERRLLVALAGIVGALLFLIGPFMALRAVSKKEAENQEVRDLIATLGESQGAIEKRRAKQNAILKRYARQTPKLAVFIDEAARANGLSAEAQDRPDNPHGKRYVEKITVAKMHRVGLRPLVKMLEKIEQSGYPVAITRLKVQPRPGEADSYEVELGVSAFERKPDPQAPGGATAAPKATATPGDVEDDHGEDGP